MAAKVIRHQQLTKYAREDDDFLCEMHEILAASVAQIADIEKKIRLRRASSSSGSPSRPETAIPNATVTGDGPSHVSTLLNRDPSSLSLPMEGEGEGEGEHTSTMVNQAEAETRSVFILVEYGYTPYAKLFEVKLKLGGGGEDRGRSGARVHSTHEPPLLEPVHCLFDSDQTSFCFMPSAWICNPPNSKLYIFPCLLISGKATQRSEGYNVDINTGSINPSSHPLAGKPWGGTLVSAYGKLYYLASPKTFKWNPSLSFESYDPDADVWNKEKPFPFYSVGLHPMEIIGYAVCYEVIWFSMFHDKRKESKVFAFDLKRNEWSEVDISCHYVPFRGRAVVVGQTVYAVSPIFPEDVLTYAFRMDEGDDGGIVYSVRNLFILKGLEVASPPFPMWEFFSEHLVHLGNRNFCHVQTGRNDENFNIQHYCITTFQIVVGKEGSHTIKTLHSTVFAVDDYYHVSKVVLCFSPDCKEYEPTKEEQPKQGETKWEGEGVKGRE